MRNSGFHSRLYLSRIRPIVMLTTLVTTAAHSEPIIDEFASGARVSVTKNCALLTVNFHVRVRYVGHFPQDHGDELRISLRPIDPSAFDQLRQINREAVAVDNAEIGGVKAVTVDLDRATGTTVRIQFKRSVQYNVGQFGGFDSIAIAIPLSGSSASCEIGNLAASGAANGQRDNGDRTRPLSSFSKPVSRGKISAADVTFIAASMDEARYAVRKGRFNEAIALMHKVLTLPDNQYSADALELLGEAHEKSGQLVQARADFEEYLRRYPDGEGVARVAQRLGKQRDVKSRGSIEAETPKAGETGRGQTDWSMSGSMSSFFIRDDSYNSVKDISIAPNPIADPDAHRLHTNTFLTNFDLYGTLNNEQARTKFKIAGADEHRQQWDSLNTDRYGISTAYVESTLKAWDVMARFGRQTRNTGGVIGRFDGGLVSWQSNERVRLNVVGGAPNWSRFDAPFKGGRYLLGASIDVAKVVGGLDASLFAIQQNDRWLLDRRAVGAEFRYFNKNKSALGMIDYDIHFQRLNAAILSGSWTLEDKSVLSASLDHRRVPYLSSWNALQAQPYLTLFDMLKYSTETEIRRYAIDRTPVFDSAMASYSRPINEQFQINVDATATRMSGTPPSGGVDGTLPVGTEYYASGQLLGTNLFRPGDMFSGALRYARLSDSNVYFFDFNSRYPWSDYVRVSPRVRAGFREGRYGPQFKEFTILPSLLVDYMLKPNLAIEAEIGTKWISSKLANTRSTSESLYVTLGLRSDFSNDGAYRCAGILAPCSEMLLGPPRPDEQVKREAIFYGEGHLDTSPPPVTSAFVLEGGVRYWRSRGDNSYDYFADQSTTLRVSRLDYSKLKSNASELFFRADARRGLIRNMFLKGYVGGGGIGGGKLYDEDFPPITTFYSKTVSDSAGRLRYGSIDLGYNIYSDDLFRLGAFAGFHSWFEAVDGRGCIQVGANPACTPPLPNSFRLIKEKDRWNSFRIGAVVDVNLTERLKWNGEIALTSASQRSLDTHFFTFGLDPAKGAGNGFQAETGLKYQLTDRLAAGIGLRWWRFDTRAVDWYGQLMKYRTDRYGIFGQISYKLGWGDYPTEMSNRY